MSLLGKILAVLNVLGVAGFVALAAMDYGKRESWAHAGYRQELTLSGLPLQADETDRQGYGVADKLTDQDRKELFPSGAVVANQEEEVRRVQNAIQSRLQGITDRQAQVLFCAETLEPFAQTAAEHQRLQAYRTRLANPKALEALKKQLGDAYKKAVEAVKKPDPMRKPRSLREAFDEALYYERGYTGEPFEGALFEALGYNPAKPTEVPSKPFDKAFDESLEVQRGRLIDQMGALFTDALERKDRSPEERKNRVARLLFNLASSQAEGAAPPAAGAEDLTADPAFRRVAAVVGVRAAVGAVRADAQALADIALGLQAQRGRELSTFAVRHGELLDLVRGRARAVDAAAAQLQRRQEGLAAHEEELKKHRLDVKQHKEELDDAREQTGKQVQDLRKLSGELFAQRVKLREHMQRNQDLEKQIRTREEGR
jgi:hypothetical protein